MVKHNVNLEVTFTDFPESLELVVRDAALEAITHLNPNEQRELTVLICDDQTIQNFNKQYRGLNNPTDVLSFENIYKNPETDNTYQGDIIISYPIAVQQSTSAKTSIESELSLLTVHGVLHLFGFDHSDEAQKTEMWSIQADILSSLGFSSRVD